MEEKLNRFTDTVRSSQITCQNGPGALVNFSEHVLMTAAPAEWEANVTPIHDARLEKRLDVHYFGLPLKTGDESTDFKKKMKYFQFPEWYYCPKCRRFMPMKDWLRAKKSLKGSLPAWYENSDEHMARRPSCPYCSSHPTLVPARLISVCKHGHIDDFPWVKWAHLKSTPKREVCSSPQLKFERGIGNQGSANFTVSCSCGARASLFGAQNSNAFHELESLSEDRYDLHCNGRHPWKGLNKSENCTEYPKAVYRGSASVYFPVNVTSLVIPPYSSQLIAMIQDSSSYQKLIDAIADRKEEEGGELSENILDKIIQRHIPKIAKEIGYDTDDECEVEQVAKRVKQLLSQEEHNEDSWQEELEYRREEYEALMGKYDNQQCSDDDFVREGHDGNEYKGLGFLKQVALIHKIREVRVQIGFSRVEPASGKEDKERFVCIKEPSADWYPGYEVRGEGLFFALDESVIERWIAAHPELEERAELINRNYGLCRYSVGKSRKISVKYLLIHSLAHAVLRQLSFECGYGIASLRERIYCDDGNGEPMNGFMIYTANGDSEGTMGGLVRQGYQYTLPQIFEVAIHKAMYCSNDPVCSLSSGQGTFSLNLAACHSCMLIPETSCEDFNAFLDRAMLVGTIENQDIGFFQLKNGRMVVSY